MAETHSSVLRPCYLRGLPGRDNANPVEVVMPLFPGDDVGEMDSQPPFGTRAGLALAGLALLPMGDDWQPNYAKREVVRPFSVRSGRPVGQRLQNALQGLNVDQINGLVISDNGRPLVVGTGAVGVRRLSQEEVEEMLSDDLVRLETGERQTGDPVRLLVTPGGVFVDYYRLIQPRILRELLINGSSTLRPLLEMRRTNGREGANYLGTVAVSLLADTIVQVGDTVQSTPRPGSSAPDVTEQPGNPILFRGPRDAGLRRRIINPGTGRLPTGTTTLSTVFFRPREETPFQIAVAKADPRARAEVHEQGIDQAVHLGFTSQYLAPTLISAIRDKFGYLFSESGLTEIKESSSIGFQRERIRDALRRLRERPDRSDVASIQYLSHHLDEADGIIMVSRRLPDAGDLGFIADEGVRMIVSPHPDEQGLEDTQWRTMLRQEQENGLWFVTTHKNGETRYFDEGVWKRIGDRRKLQDRVGLTVYGSSQHPANPEDMSLLTEIAQKIGDRVMLLTGAGPIVMEQARQAVADTDMMTVGIGTNLLYVGEPSFFERYDAALKMVDIHKREHLLDQYSSIPVIFRGSDGTNMELSSWIEAIRHHHKLPTPICFIGEDNYLYTQTCQRLAEALDRNFGDPLISKLIRHYTDSDTFVQDIEQFVDDPSIFWRSLETDGVFSPGLMKDILRTMKDHYAISGIPLPKIAVDAEMYANSEAL